MPERRTPAQLAETERRTSNQRETKNRNKSDSQQVTNCGNVTWRSLSEISAL